MVPWALGGQPGSDDAPTVAAPALAQRPLPDVGGGVTVREVGQDTPFSMVALTADDLRGTEAKVRARRADGSWGPWYDAHPLESDAAPSASGAGPAGTEPVFVGETTRVQISVTRPTAPPAPDLGYIPAGVSQPMAQNVNAVLITLPTTTLPANTMPANTMPMPTAATPPGQPPAIVTRAQWGADEGLRCGAPQYDDGVRAAVVHHTAGSNDYSPEQSAEIVRSIYAYHTRTLRWCDIGYNALVDKYGQVFEGRAGGITEPVEGSHTGGFNTNTWGVALIGDFRTEPPSPIQLKNAGRLLGWRLAMAGVDPMGAVALPSAGGSFTKFARGFVPHLPTIFTHRDVGITECPGDAAYAAMGRLREIAKQFTAPPTLEERISAGAIGQRWLAMAGANGPLGAPTSPEAPGDGDARYVRFTHGAIYWSPDTGAQPVGGAIYDAWASLGFERGPLGLPTSAEIGEPEWIVQNFQHGTLNFDRQHASVTGVVDGVVYDIPAPPADGVPVQIERFAAPRPLPAG